MKKITLFLSLTLLALNVATAQQDAMFTKYAFNALSYNPAYAGSANVLSMTLLHRHQWFLFEGAPITQSLSIHSPLRNEKIGLGLTLMNDKIGRSNQTSAFASYAYRLPLNGGNAHLSLGIQGGVTNYRANFTETRTEFEINDDFDPAFNNARPNYWLPNFGVGVYYQSKKAFIGLGIPQLLNNSLRNEGNVNTAVSAQQYRHYFVTGGLVMKLTNQIDFRPIVMWKNVGMFFEKNAINKVAAPNELDLDLSFLFRKTLWLGTALRTAVEGKSSWDSVDFWAQYIFKNNLRIGVAYDVPLSQMRQPGGGSYEIMLGYDFNYNTDNIVSTRYF